jgi:hypothetical protein
MAAIEVAAHVDVAEDLQVPGLAPARVVQLEQVALRDRAGIVDQDVDAACLLDHGLARLGPRQIGGMNLDRHVVPRPDLVARALEVRGGARHQEQAAPLAREFLRDRASDPLRRAADQDRAAFQVEVHQMRMPCQGANCRRFMRSSAVILVDRTFA